ncbi:rapamycin-insensitive companion of mTOR [Anomaloglossus baeobatrachus]|uniref:rapamycin-insensitive companion of mTOR n=1 Tax=Anomaloglossus baeobatrachus TaxID=238106 RepID=UPI003F4F6B0D
MAASIRARSLRHLRIRGRNDSGEENVPIDLSREPSDNLREILQNVAKLHGVSNMRKLGHLNNFIKLLCNVGHSEEKLGFYVRRHNYLANLHALIQMKPALSHLGDKGLLLLLRFLSIPKGFSYLNERGYVTKELEKWQKEYNLKYVDLIEEQLNEALTTYRKPVDGDNYVRRSNQRVLRPYVYLPVHLYGQLVHHKTGCHLLEVQNVVPDLSYTVRSPSLDNWEGIKQLKAALWSLGNIGSSNWGLNLLQEENVIPDIIALALHCEVLSIRGTCAYVLGLLSKTKQGCDILKQHNWDTVRHSRRHPWPVVPDDMEQLCNELCSIPSTLSLNSESTSSRHNSESESALPSMFIIEDDPCGNSSPSPFFLYDDPEQTFFDKPLKDKDRSPFTLLAQSKFVKNRFLNSLTLPSKKFRSSSSSSDPKTSKLRDLRRNRTVTEPWSDSDFPSMDSLGSVFKVPKISTSVSKHVDDNGSTPSITENDLKLPKSLGNENHRDHTSRERLIGDGSTTTHLKSRSLSFNTDTTTSGISSMSSSPSRETVGIDTTNMDTDCGSLSTVISTKTVRTNLPIMLHPNHLPLSKSNSVSLVPPGSSHTLPRRAQSLKAPSIGAIKTLADYHFTYTSSRDAFGYATLKRLQQHRMHPSLSHSDALASPAKDVLFTDTITMKTGSLDSRLTSSRFMKALSYASLDKEDLLSPITQTSLQRSSSVRSMVSNAAYGSSEDYIGLALPLDINDMFQVKETPYFQKIVPTSDDRTSKVFAPEVAGVTGSGVKSPYQALRQQFSITEIMNSSRSDASQFLENMEDTGLQEHTDDNCLYCVGIQIVGCNGSLANEYSRLDFPDIPYSDWCAHSIPNHLEVVSQSSKYSGISGCSDAVSQGSAGSTKSTELVLGGKSIPEDTPMCRILLRKEVLRLVINLSSSVGTKGHENGLLTIKEKFPQAFDDICLYSEVSYLLAHCTFRLPSRRFIQELFQDVQFQIMHEEAEGLLAVPPKQPVLCTDAES